MGLVNLRQQSIDILAAGADPRNRFQCDRVAGALDNLRNVILELAHREFGDQRLYPQCPVCDSPLPKDKP